MSTCLILSIMDKDDDVIEFHDNGDGECVLAKEDDDLLLLTVADVDVLVKFLKGLRGVSD